MSALSDSEEKIVRLRSNDNEEFELEESVAASMSEAIRHLIEDGCASQTIPVPNVNGETLAKVIDYCNVHGDENAVKDDLDNFDKEFFDVDIDVIYELLLAANFLHMKNLLDKLCEKVASLIRKKSPAQIRKTFNIENDFTKEEEHEIRKNNWVFNGKKPII